MGGETEQSVSGWTVDTAMAHLERRFEDQRRLLDERYATQTKALDAAFASAERAVQTARESQERQAERTELANKDRFASVNEFRAQLADQVATFLPRQEALALLDRQRGDLQRINERMSDMETRLNVTQGQTVGQGDAMATRRAQTGQMIATITVVVSVIAVAVAVILGTR